MNGATAKLWREIMSETGNDTGGTSDLPSGCSPTSNRNKGSDTDRKSDSSIVARPKPTSPSIHKYM